MNFLDDLEEEARERLVRAFSKNMGSGLAGTFPNALPRTEVTARHNRPNIVFHGHHHHGCSVSERERRAVLGSWTFIPEIERVIFNDPATIVIFKNGEKIVVKRTEDDEFNPEAGLAMAIARKYIGSRTAFKKLVKENGGYDSGE